MQNSKFKHRTYRGNMGGWVEGAATFTQSSQTTYCLNLESCILNYKPPAKKRPLKTLERVLSKAGVGSRTEAGAWVAQGRVKDNGTITRDPDHWIDMHRDRVGLDDKPLETRQRLYILPYQPSIYPTTYKDPKGRPTVYPLVPAVRTFVPPVGRLDLDTSGLLLMTNDTQFAERVTNPLAHVPKTY